MSELKPCPFCGGKARMHVAFASGGDHSVGVYVECLECRSCSETKWGDGAQEKAADAWDRRANDCDREDLLARADAMGNMPCERREEVVRCRDCGRAYRRGGGVYCSRVLQWGSNDRPAPLPVNPDGFCAWGERRDEQCAIG